MDVELGRQNPRQVEVLEACARVAGFAYRANIDPLIFVFAALAAGAVAFATVAAQSWRTANADPVNSLRQV